MFCDRCGQEIVPDGAAAGYGVSITGLTICYDCCAIEDKANMDASGKAILYLCKDEGRWQVTNWPGTLSFRASVTQHKRGHFSPFAGYMPRYDAWFVDVDGHLWHGRSIGDNTQIIHCTRLKDTAANLADARRIARKFGQ